MKSSFSFRPARLAAAVLFASFVAPGAWAQATVEEVDSPAPADTRMTLADNETFQNPLPSADNAMPEYPSNMLPHNLPPQAVCVRVSIDAKGAVTGTAPIGAGPDCPAEANAAAAFYDAAQQAAQTWQYDPAFRCVYPKGTKPDNRGCFGDEVEEVPEAVSMVYRFMFEQAEGKGSVRFAN
jgi:hypothetical protein